MFKRSGNLVQIKDRESGKIKEKKYNSHLYKTVVGRATAKVLTKPFISKFVGTFMNSFLSIVLVKAVVRKNRINLEETTKLRYRSYNDFFTRKLLPSYRKVDMSYQSLVSPCNSKLLVYKINNNNLFKIKDTYYSTEDLLKNDIYKEYNNGYILVFRLEVSDYHRYCYIDNGTQEKNIFIKGKLNTVRPIAHRKINIYKENCREWTVLKTENFNDVIECEIGAMLVGKIVNLHQNYNFKKGEEKGYFEFGGSTIALLFKENTIKIDKDILTNSELHIETIVKYGEKIGRKIY